MELWIRSQDKTELLKVRKKISIEPQECFDIRNNETIEIGEYLIIVDGYSLGKYCSKRRASKVLDEIQKLLVPDIKLLSKKINEDQEDDLSDLKTLFSVIQPDGELQIHQLHNVIYQMPQE